MKEHRSTGKTEVCVICGRTFDTVNGLSAHQLRRCKPIISFAAQTSALAKLKALRRARVLGAKVKALESSRTTATQPPLSTTTAAQSSSHGANVTDTVDDNTMPFMDVDAVQHPFTPVEPEKPVTYASGRPGRTIRLPARYRDELPTEPVHVDDVVTSIPEVDSDSSNVNDIALRLSLFRSESDKYGLYRVYKQVDIPLDLRQSQSADTGTFINRSRLLLYRQPHLNPSLYAPHPNYASFLINQWFWAKHGQTQENLNRLQNIIIDNNILPEDLASVNFNQINKKLGDSSLDDYFNSDDGWRSTPFKIPIPLGHLHPDAPIKVELPIKEFYHRSLTGIICSVFRSRITSNNFCYEPYELRFKPLTGEPDMAVHRELYWSKQFRDAHAEVLHLTRVDADDNFPRAVVALQFWSDGMAAMNFGNAKIWPAYVQFGNQSKYERSIPSSKSIHHFAHIPSACVSSSFLLSVRSVDVFFLSKLPDTFQDFIRSQAKGEKASDDLQTHCRREIMHGVWKVILDDDLRHAWQFGMVVECGDGLIHRLNPRIFTYSTDYPEKVLLATIKALGSHPCPRCLVHKKDIHRLGQKRDDLARIKLLRVDDDTRRCKVDNARQFMFNERKRVTHAGIKNLLDDQSMTPVENVFSSRLGDLGFNFHSMLVIDVMHEWEVGVWRQIFTHLVRILDLYRSDKVHELNKRYRGVSSFKTSCALPLFEGLLQAPHDKIILDMIFLAATTHALAKLRMHMDAMAAYLRESTKQLAGALHKFKTITCVEHATAELPQEAEKRLRREAAIQSRTGKGKGHARGESEHKTSKDNYKRLNKVKVTRQLTDADQRKMNLNVIDNRIKQEMNVLPTLPADATGLKKDVPDLALCYHIGKAGEVFHLRHWLIKHRLDPATKDFHVLFFDYIIAHLTGRDAADEPTFSEEDCMHVVIWKDRMYEHKKNASSLYNLRSPT
ncbi:hypothetical protein EW145_g6253 [Phellinidium pouzarii]|uniref:Uncharacterized protein n=1 Tax=Phellinidium pouzarii TaxID=167371 RepID=A0A4S4KXE2_9AGAM|nr:hypothetical protein EW145_g6253 [Phellinidium pouzarii]